MVTKLSFPFKLGARRSVLAKIFMVTKRSDLVLSCPTCSVLAKIFMVTKPSGLEK